jgi:hypothetical protein
MIEDKHFLSMISLLVWFVNLLVLLGGSVTLRLILHVSLTVIKHIGKIQWGEGCICSMERLYFGDKVPLKAEDEVGHVGQGEERAVRTLSRIHPSTRY